MPNYETPNFSMDLSDQVALVTGASSGLGYRFAKVLAKCGAKVAISARRIDKLEVLKQEIESDGGICAVVPIDMSDRVSIREAVAAVEGQLGTITTLVNNAGMPDAQWAVKQSDELIDTVMGTNLTGPYILSCEVARKLMQEKLPGRMVNIASMAAFHTTAQSAAPLYSITKKALVRMTETLAVEWAGRNINVNAIAPGFFSSEMTDGMLERIGDITPTLNRKRIPTAEQMDSTLLFLLSPSSECVTGTCIKIDDGQMAR